MAKVGEKNVITGNAVILWDGITQPEANDSGKMVHSIKVAMLPTDPSVAEIEQLALAELATSVFKGVKPHNCCWPGAQSDPSKYDGKIAGQLEFSVKTFNGAPQVFDANNTPLDPMQYAQQLYPGAIVNVLCHCYSYDNKSKGVSLGLDGIRIMDATAPRLPVGAGGIDAAAAFGGAAPPAPAVVAPVAAAVVAPVAAQPAVVAPIAAIVQPAPDMLQPVQPVYHMTAAANGATREQYHAVGNTDEQLIAAGMMVQV